ncbi:MAG: hypothetical protein JNM76_17755 [Betaproteobacteria bacterium]|nr:hypothetical protein [Betaproteobacteria bacterium]
MQLPRSRPALATLCAVFIAALLPLAASGQSGTSKAAAAKPAAPSPKVHFILTPRWQGEAWHFLVEARFPATTGTETAIDLPDEFGPARNMHANIRNLESLDPGVTIKEGAKPAQRVLAHKAKRPPGQPLRLRYEVHNKQRDKLSHESFYDPILEPGWFHLVGHGVFVQPAHFTEKDSVDLTIEWRNIPDDWSLAGSHGIKAGATTVWNQRNVALQLARHAIYVGGDFRLHKTEIRGRPLYIAVRGERKFKDEDFVAATQKVVAAHREFWGDFDFPHFLITHVANSYDSGSYGGTALHHAFAMHTAADFTVASAAFDFLIGHEHLHTWVPSRIGIRPKGADEGLSYWFSEGFTNYLTHRLLVKSGLWSRERYAEAINKLIQRYLASPARNFDNRTTADNFWKRRDAGDMPYQRGELVALRWNAALAAQGESLDSLLKKLQTRDANGEMATDRLIRALKPHLAGVEQDVARFVDRGETVELGGDLLGPCYEKRNVPVPQYEAGFNVNETIKNRMITGIVEGSAAWRAGLRNGMKTRSLSIRQDDVDNDVKISVEDADGQAKKMDYRPVKEVAGLVPQYFVKAGADTDKACMTWF